MLPASFQTPAAVILVAGGLMSCFAGYRLFRFVLAFFGFVLGALAASSAMGADQTLWMIGAALIGGVIGALILVVAYFAGVALIGAGIGAGLAMAIWAALGREPGIVPVLVLAIAGALAALALQRYVIILVRRLAARRRRWSAARRSSAAGRRRRPRAACIGCIPWIRCRGPAGMSRRGWCSARSA